MSDAGVYKCKFQNEQGEDETQGKVQIKPVSHNLIFCMKIPLSYSMRKIRCSMCLTFLQAPKIEEPVSYILRFNTNFNTFFLISRVHTNVTKAKYLVAITFTHHLGYLT